MLFRSRAANAQTLIQQSIGRGLRLPYGRKTGVEVVDRLNIIAHDKFQEVVDEAGRGDSPIRLKQLKLDPAGESGGGLRSLAVTPTINALLGIGAGRAGATAHTLVDGTYATGVLPATVVYTGGQSKVAQLAMDVINEMSRTVGGVESVVPTSASLTKADVQAEIVRRVEERMGPTQVELLLSAGPTLADIVQHSATVMAAYTIDIPRILVTPKGAVQAGYKPFVLDVSRMSFQPQDQQLVGRGLQSGKDVLYGQASTIGETRLEDYIVRELIGFDDVSYDAHADLIHGLAGQVVTHFKTYLKTDAELHNVLVHQAKAIAENIHVQMAMHYFEDIGESEVVVSQGFTPLKPSAVTIEGEVLMLHQPPPEKSKIASVVYGGFTRCAYDHQKFQSDTERILALILERDSLRWFRPLQSQFNIYYRRGVEQPEYVPDFVAGTLIANLLIETKMAKDIDSEEVQAKANAAVEWCAHASAYSAKHDGKPWRYLLIPHDAVAVNVTLAALAIRFGRL